MARNLNVYPKVHLNGSVWLVRIKMSEKVWSVPDEDWMSETIEHTEPSTVPAQCSDQHNGQLLLLKLVFGLTIADTDTFQDVADALLVDDIRPGPQTETVWGNWKDLAESILSGMTLPYTRAEFWGEWRPQDTASVRNDARRALVTQRGWTITDLKWAEGDGTVGYG